MCKNLINTLFLISIVFSETLNVPGDYANIQDAINAASDGDIINVLQGTYAEQLTIGKSVVLKTEENAIIDASNFSNGIMVGASNGLGCSPEDYVSDVEIDGFEILGGLNTISGIQILPCSQNILIQNNEIHGMRAPNQGSDILASYGILSWGVGPTSLPININILNNEIYDIRAMGISLGTWSSDVTIQGNNIYDINEIELSDGSIPGFNFSVGINAQFSIGDFNVSNNTFSNIVAAIIHTFVGYEITVENNQFNNVNLFYTVDDDPDSGSYASEENTFNIDFESFGNYVQSYFTLPASESVANLTETRAIGWFSNIQDAINAADEETQVVLNKGTFQENIIWPDKNLELIGSGIDSTIISGDNTVRVVEFSSVNIDDDSVIKNLTIQNGKGGILIDGASPIIDSCKITNNIAVNDVGGGIKIIGLGPDVVDPIIKNSIIVDNESIGDESISGAGGGIYITDGATPVLSKNLIAFNSATSSNLFKVGEAKGGAIMSYYSFPSIENNTIYGNTSWQYNDCGLDGLCPEDDDYLESDTGENDGFVDDSTSIAGGIYLRGDNPVADAVIEKTIIWNNSPVSFISEQDDAVISYSNIENYDELIATNIDENPLFCDPINFDFTLADNSPCSLGTLEFMGAYNTGGCGNIILDCNDVPGGSAYLDECNDCVGGDTSLNPCEQDCLGEWGGTHYINSDGDCCAYDGSECLLIDSTYFPSKLNINSVFPNPFNPTANIEYSIPSFMQVSIRVYDLSGRLIKTLVDNEAHYEGVYNLSMNTFQMPTGTYFLKLNSGLEEINYKITVVK